jgi:hypothetical protein
MYSCFRPGDLVRAEVISLGDARSYYLSTAKNSLGVVSAKTVNGQLSACLVTVLKDMFSDALPFPFIISSCAADKRCPLLLTLEAVFDRHAHGTIELARDAVPSNKSCREEESGQDQLGRYHIHQSAEGSKFT